MRGRDESRGLRLRIDILVHLWYKASGRAGC